MFQPLIRLIAALARASVHVLLPTALAAASRVGLLLLAHGLHAHIGHPRHASVNRWNANVEQRLRRLNERRPTEVAFGIADPRISQISSSTPEQSPSTPRGPTSC